MCRLIFPFVVMCPCDFYLSPVVLKMLNLTHKDEAVKKHNV